MKSVAQREAARIFADFNCSIPVDLEAIVKGLGLSIRKDVLEEEVSGMTVIPEKGPAIICINREHPRNRQRFSLAHEIGHYVLHRKANHVFVNAPSIYFRDESSSHGTVTQEIEANSFAAELLMPEDEVRREFNAHPFDVFDEKAVAELSKRFSVSSQAMTIRLASLGLVFLPHPII